MKMSFLMFLDFTVTDLLHVLRIKCVKSSDDLMTSFFKIILQISCTEIKETNEKYTSI